MRRANIFIVVMFMAAVLLHGCGSGEPRLSPEAAAELAEPLPDQVPSASALTADQCAILDDESAKSAECYIRLAVAYKEANACHNINGYMQPDLKIRCYGEAAAAASDPEICKQMQLPSSVDADAAYQECGLYLSRVS